MSFRDAGGPGARYLSEDGGRGPSRWRLRLVTGAVAMAALGAFALLVWYAYNLGIRTGTESVAPLIRAEARPAKIRPEQPGGMEVPDRDKYVYERLESAEPVPRVERLLPEPEEPMPKPAAAAPVPAPAAPALPQPPAPSEALASLTRGEAEEAPEAEAPPGSANLPQPSALAPPTPSPQATNEPEAAPQPPPPPPAAAPAPTEQAAAPAPPPVPAPQPAVPTAPAPPPVPAPQPAAPTVPAAAPGPAFRIQLAALRTEVQATAAWRRLLRAHQNLLGGLVLTLQRVDLGTRKGVFHRVQAGPLASIAEARGLCAALKVRDQDCLVVRP